MSSIVEYLLSVTGASIICCCILMIAGKNNSWSAVIKVLCGVFVAITVIQPLTTLQLTKTDLWDAYLPETAEKYSTEGEVQARAAQIEFIKERTETYILEKAGSYNCSLQVSVSISEEAPYAPSSVQIVGSASPYVKHQITVWIEDTLNIPAEEQMWIS